MVRNDDATGNDVFTGVAGNDVNSGTDTASPKRNISTVVALASANDTIYIDNGFYQDTPIVITVSNLTIIGADSRYTTVDCAVADSNAFIAVGQSNLAIRNLGITDSYNGIDFNNVDYSEISGDSISGNSYTGIYFYNYSSYNRIVGNNLAYNNGNAGVFINYGDNNLIADNYFAFQNTTNGAIKLAYTAGDSVINNRCDTSATAIDLLGADAAYVGGNIVVFATTGISVTTGGDSNVVTGNTISQGTGNAINCNSNDNLFADNSISGFQNGVANYGQRNVFRSNRIGGCTDYGILLSSASNGVLIGNRVVNCQDAGLYLSGSSGNLITGNDFDSNATTQISVASCSDTLVKNNILAPPLYPTGGISITAGVLHAVQNWWGSVDSAAVNAQVTGAGSGGVTYEPWRLNMIDTTPGADTVAPEPPSVVTCTPGVGTIIVGWTPSLFNEDGSFHGGSGVAGYRIYRTFAFDSWIVVANVGAGVTAYADTGLGTGVTAYYQVFAYDSHTPHYNVGWCDTMASATTFGGMASVTMQFMNATYVLAVDSYAVGDTAYLQVEAADANEDTAATDSMTLRVVNVTSGDSDWVTLFETAVSSGAFRGTFLLVAGDSVSGNLQLGVTAGEVVRADTGEIGTVIDTVTVVAAPPNTAGPNAWYVNDTATAGDLFCTVAGNAGYN
ncbi:MAG TPA: NosD domain-containing protein, partial [bacterium]|nr:NosD domain-containing protein [bacterium]